MIDRALALGLTLAIVVAGGWALAESTASSTRLFSPDGRTAVAVSSSPLAGTEAGLVVRVAGPVSTTAPTGLATEATLSTINGKLPALVSGRVPVDGSGVTQPVSASSLPLPADAARDSTLVGVSGQLPAALVGGRLAVDGSGVVQPVSGSVTSTPTLATSLGAAQLDVTASAQQLGSNASRAVCVKNLEASSLPVYVGSASVTTTNGDELSVGESRCYALDNTDRIYVRASGTGSRVSFSWVN